VLDTGLIMKDSPNSLNRATTGPAGNQIGGAALGSPMNCAPHQNPLANLTPRINPKSID
jgi:hypothetical protein